MQSRKDLTPCAMKKLTCAKVLLLIGISLILPRSLHAQETYRVTKVVDGDTIRVRYEWREENVRLIGIDCPEARRNPKAVRAATRSDKDLRTILKQGKEATKFVQSLVQRGDRVRFQYDVQKHDRYGRLLAYVYLENGEMLNEIIVREGYAGLATIPPNIKHEFRFKKAYSEARNNNKGLWKN